MSIDIKIKSNENLDQKLMVVVENIFCCDQDARKETVSFKLQNIC